MILVLRVSVLSLFFGSVLCLNHGNFLGGGNGDTRTSDMQSPEEFFRNNELLNPVSPPPSLRPTPSPTVFSPTRAPIPAGRFATPVPNPNLEAGTATGSGGRSTPTSNNNQRSPPTFARYPGSSKDPTEANSGDSPEQTSRVRPVAASQQRVDTRIASYKAEWGSNIQYCQNSSANVIFNCHDGGKIALESEENAKCRKVADDRIMCAQIEIDSYSSLEFTCSGIRKNHLMSTATVDSNSVENCKRDVNAVKILTMSRKCANSVDINPKCKRGIEWSQGDVVYCTYPYTCRGEGNCSEFNLGPLAMSDTNVDLGCSRVDPDQDLQFASFDKSYLSSISSIDWRISGKKRGCSWDPSPLSLRCEDGGTLEFVENYDFCFTEGNTGECKIFAPEESEKSTSLRVRCVGESASQLKLSVEIPPSNKDVKCVVEGTIIQSVMLSQVCRESGSAESILVNNQSFCDFKKQVFTTDENHTHCYAGSECSSDDGCDLMQLPYVAANTVSGSMQGCIYIL